MMSGGGGTEASVPGSRWTSRLKATTSPASPRKPDDTFVGECVRSNTIELCKCRTEICWFRWSSGALQEPNTSEKQHKSLQMVPQIKYFRLKIERMGFWLSAFQQKKFDKLQHSKVRYPCIPPVVGWKIMPPSTVLHAVDKVSKCTSA